MRMTFPIVIGALVLLAGVSILLEAIFKIHFPFLRSAFALLLIFFGVRMLIGAWSPRLVDTTTSGAAVMSELTFAPTKAAPSMKYDVVFGQGAIDLTRLDRPKEPAVIEVNVIFGSATVTIDPALPTVVEGNAAFGDLRLPDKSAAAFGNARYATGLGEPVLKVRINTIFGNCVVQNAPHEAEGPGPISAVLP